MSDAKISKSRVLLSSKLYPVTSSSHTTLTGNLLQIKSSSTSFNITVDWFSHRNICCSVVVRLEIFQTGHKNWYRMFFFPYRFFKFMMTSMWNRTQKVNFHGKNIAVTYFRGFNKCPRNLRKLINAKINLTKINLCEN